MGLSVTLPVDRGRITQVTVNGRTYPVDPPVTVEQGKGINVSFDGDGVPTVTVFTL